MEEVLTSSNCTIASTMPLPATHTPSVTLPSLPTPARLSRTSFGRPRHLVRTRAETAPWDFTAEESDDEDYVGHGIALPIQLDLDHDDSTTRRRSAISNEGAQTWRRSGSRWSAIQGVDNRTGSTASSYTSIYPLSTSPSFSQSTFFDSDAPTTSSVAYSDDISYDPFEAQSQPDWAPWLSNSPPSTPNRRSYFLDDVAGPSLLPRKPQSTRSHDGRPILMTSTTFYLPPLFADKRPTFATPRRTTTATFRNDSRSSIPSRASTPRPRDGCSFALCLSRSKPPKPEREEPNVVPRRNPNTLRGKPGYRISFVQDRQWRAHILNEAVEQSLTSTLIPKPPKPSKSKYDTPSPPPSTHRTKGNHVVEDPPTSLLAENPASDARPDGHQATAADTAISSVVPQATEPSTQPTSEKPTQEL